MSGMMTVKEVADLLRVAERTVVEWARTGRIPAGKISGVWRFKSGDINDWVAKSFSPGIGEGTNGRVSIDRVLTPERTIVLDEVKKQDVFDRLVSLLAASGNIQSTEELAEALAYREKLLSTGIGLGVAVPHARLASVKQLTMAVALCRKSATDYESLDKKPVQLVFMIAAGRFQHREHITLLSAISRIVKDESRRHALLNSPDAESLFGLLVEYDR